MEDKDYQTALAGLRDTATENGYMPRQIMLGAPQRTNRQDDQPTQEDEEEDAAKQSNKETDKKTEADPDDLDIRDKVLIKHHKTGRWNKEAGVI